MNRKALFWPLAAMLLTACEKGLVDGVADVAPAGQAANSVLKDGKTHGDLFNKWPVITCPHHGGWQPTVQFHIEKSDGK